MVDALATLFLLVGLACSGLVTPMIALALLVAYYFLTINMGFATHALGVFKISFGLVGGTELRLLLALVNLVVLAKPRLAWEGHEVLGLLGFDVIALGATMGVAFTALRSTAQVTKRLYEMEGLDYRKDGPMQLVLWPAVITMGITLLRLFGELQGWAPAFFSRAPGGGGALVGISWLPFVLGPYFAVKLAKSGRGPASPWKAAGLAFLGLLIAVGGFGLVGWLKLEVWAALPAFLLSLAVSFLPYGTWPELGRTLFRYALAARVPVVIVMLFAIYGKWGTHYDFLPRDAPPALVAMGPLELWFFGGFVPQLTVWIAYTVLVSTLLGASVVAIMKPKASAS